jgi:3,4-dihydroxy 2-butanone 4-phosphate synthase / GTP cyclohydrolase II
MRCLPTLLAKCIPIIKTIKHKNRINKSKKMIVNLHNSTVNTVSEYRSVRNEKYPPVKTVEQVTEANLPTRFGSFRIIVYRSLTSDEEFVVLTRGFLNSESPVMVRIHSQCLTGDVFGSTKCDCGQQLEEAMKMIAEADCGVIVYQQQEGRGIGIINKIRAYALQDEGADTIEANERLGFAADLRRYEQCAEILFDLGLKRVRLISNNPEKVLAVRNCGLEIIERVPLKIKYHQKLIRYLKTKRDEMGHHISLPENV